MCNECKHDWGCNIIVTLTYVGTWLLLETAYTQQALVYFISYLFRQDISHDQLLQRVSEVTSIPRYQQMSHTDLLLNTSDAQEMMDLSESLFSSLKHPFDFPTSKELGMQAISRAVLNYM